MVIVGTMVFVMDMLNKLELIPIGIVFWWVANGITAFFILAGWQSFTKLQKWSVGKTAALIICVCLGFFSLFAMIRGGIKIPNK